MTKLDAKEQTILYAITAGGEGRGGLNIRFT
jgi:hypothetical protein